MSQTNPAIRCRKCGTTFEPDVKTNGTWPCPSCQTKNPNLKRHYRSVADVCILGLIFTLLVVVFDVTNAGLNLGVLLSAAHAVLLLVTIVLVYKSKTPWADSTAKTLIWVALGLPLLFKVATPLMLGGRLNISRIIVPAVVFLYVFWLNMQAGKCTASEPPTLPATKS
jgi:hypothetical protein